MNNNVLFDKFLLPTLESKNSNNLGLLHGRAGIAIVYYLLGKHTAQKHFKEKGQICLNTISDNWMLIREFNFSEGAIGIGWAIEWLVQNNFLKNVNTDDVLEDIDDLLYKTIIFSKEKNISLYNGVLGKFAYYLKRASSINYNPQHFRQIINQECLVLLINDLKEMLIGEKGLLRTNKLFINKIYISFSHFIDIGNTLLLLSNDMQINSPLREIIIYEIVEYIEDKLSTIIKSIKNPQTNDYIQNIDNYYNILYLNICYLIASKKYKHNSWNKRARYYINQLISYENYFQMEEMTEKQLFTKLIVYCLLSTSISTPQYKHNLQKIIFYLSSLSNKPNLYYGLGSIIIAELSLKQPTLVKNWDELFFI